MSLKPPLVLHPTIKQPASTLEFQYFYSILQKKILKAQTKKGRAPLHAGSSCAWAGLWPAVMRMLSTSQRFQTFLRHNYNKVEWATPSSALYVWVFSHWDHVCSRTANRTKCWTFPVALRDFSGDFRETPRRRCSNTRSRTGLMLATLSYRIIYLKPLP